MTVEEDRFEALRRDLRAFVEARDWDRFHNPKDLALALSVEAGELLETFLWREDGRVARVREETADVVLYALLLADKMGFDLLTACREKLEANALKYPVETARGRADKYTEL